LHEEFINGTVDQLLAHFDKNAPRGEIVLLIAGKDKKSALFTDAQIIDSLNEPSMQELPPSARAKAVAQKLGVSKSRVYSLILSDG